MKKDDFFWQDLRKIFPGLRWSTLNCWILDGKVDCIQRGHGRKRIFSQKSVEQIKTLLGE